MKPKSKLKAKTKQNRYYKANRVEINTKRNRRNQLRSLEDNVFEAEEVEQLLDTYADLEGISFKKSCKIAKVKGMDWIESEVLSAQEANHHDREEEDEGY